MTYDVVIPTTGRRSLTDLLRALSNCRGPRPGRIFVVDDRRRPGGALPVEKPCGLTVRVLQNDGVGPAAARNTGWWESDATWIAFLDDDVLPAHDWAERLETDLRTADERTAGSQGHVVVPVAAGRRPTDWERGVQALERAEWVTADMAYRREALASVGGFEERFPRAYREDADLALRLMTAGHLLTHGTRTVVHPVQPADRWASLRRQAGNADDALMLLLHGPRWRRRAGDGSGRRVRHLAITLAAATAIGAGVTRRWRLAAAAATTWLLGTTELAAARILPGTRSADETATMLLTSLLIPPAAVFHWVRGLTHVRARLASRPEAVLFDRDGTLVEDVPYNGDPSLVRLRPGAQAALDRLRRRGVPIGVISNQSGVARGLLDREQVEAVNRRVEELAGPIAVWAICPHAPEDGCSCRKPRPGLVIEAAAALGVPPERCAVIGDIGADVAAAAAAGARAVLVPTLVTRPEEIAAAPEVAVDLPGAVALLLGEPR